MLVFAELGSGQSNLVNMYTWTPAQRERWRVQRKLMHSAVGVQQVRKYRSFQNDESRVVAYDLLKKPEDYVKHFERYATSVVSIIGFGRRVEDSSDPIITEGEFPISLSPHRTLADIISDRGDAISSRAERPWQNFPHANGDVPISC